MLSLIEDVERKVDKKKAEKFAKKVAKGKGFDLEDLRDQLQQMKNMGGMAGMMDKLPGMGNMAQMAQQQNAPVNLVEWKHYQFYDPKRAPQPRYFKWLAQASHYRWVWYQYSGSQPSAKTAQADGQDDEKNEGQRHAKYDARHGWADGSRGRLSCRQGGLPQVVSRVVTLKLIRPLTGYWGILNARLFYR